MEESNSDRPHDETGDAADALPQEGRSAARLGLAAGATSRSFVVEVVSEPTGGGEFCGRVRHLATLDGGNFSSGESLVSIIRGVLERLRPKQSERDELPGA